MKITCSIYTLKQLNKFAKYIDCAVLNTKKYSLVYEDLDLDKAILFCENNNILPIIAVNKLLHPSDLVSVNEVFLKYISKNILFLVTDLGAIQIAKRLNIINRIIYDPQTMITNKLDLEEYSKIGCDSLSMSLEIPLNDVNNSINDNSIFYQIFGHRIMFYSNRKLVSLYEEKANIKVSNNHLYLKEATRDDYLPIIENENGTMIYRPYCISLLKEKDIISKFKYGYMESLYLDDDIFLKVLIEYKNAISKNNIDESIVNINNLGLNIEEGFTYKDSIYQKELF